MKKIIILVIFLFNFIQLSCKKDIDSIMVPDAEPGTLRANAGEDIKIRLPGNEMVLSGTWSGGENNIADISWRKISGPASFKMINEKTLNPTISQLVRGTYEFELKVTDSKGAYSIDILTVVVLNVNEYLFENLEWIYPWYPSLEVRDFSSLIPPGAQYNVYVKREGEIYWRLVDPLNSDPGASYEYFIETRPDGAGIYNFGSLYIFYFGWDTSDKPSILIVAW